MITESLELRSVPTIVLAGGLGSRLWPVTRDRIPKPLVQVGEQTLLDHTLRLLHDHGIERVLVVVGHRARQVRRAVRHGRWSTSRVKFCMAGPTSPLVGLLQAAIRSVHLDGDFLFCCADEVRDGLDLRRFWQSHRTGGGSVTLAATRLREDRGQYLLIDANGGGGIRQFLRGRDGDRTSGSHVSYLGITAVSGALIPRLMALPPQARERDFVDCARLVGPLRTWIAPDVNYWHVATPEDLARARQGVDQPVTLAQ